MVCSKTFGNLIVYSLKSWTLYVYSTSLHMKLLMSISKNNFILIKKKKLQFIYVIVDKY